jgi:endonuclease/exonuclease/phosphatase family metal-dependent hydrolase
VIVTHLGLRPAERRYQVKLLLSLLHPFEPGQIVVALGDINSGAHRATIAVAAWQLDKPPSSALSDLVSAFALDRVRCVPRPDRLAHPHCAPRVASDTIPQGGHCPRSRH